MFWVRTLLSSDIHLFWELYETPSHSSPSASSCSLVYDHVFISIYYCSRMSFFSTCLCRQLVLHGCQLVFQASTFGLSQDLNYIYCIHCYSHPFSLSIDQERHSGEFRTCTHHCAIPSPRSVVPVAPGLGFPVMPWTSPLPQSLTDPCLQSVF